LSLCRLFHNRRRCLFGLRHFFSGAFWCCLTGGLFAIFYGHLLFLSRHLSS
jgi:hypothetical protein